MDADIAKKLREPFAPDTIGKLPRVTCRDCSGRSCQKHQKAKCQGCGNYISTAHIHLDYAGHAAITDRLLSVDPSWTWGPLAIGQDGLPVLDKNGGLWIRLTVAGVTRLGYGDAEGKNGPAAVKEAIGDALRNGAMRFGVGLDLWHKDGVLAQHDDEPASVAPQQPQNMGSGVSRGGPVKEQQVNGNARQRPAQPPQDAPPAEPTPSPADRERAAIAKLAEANGWTLAAVSVEYGRRYDGEDIRATQNANRLKAFAKLLPDAMNPVTNGAAQ